MANYLQSVKCLTVGAVFSFLINETQKKSEFFFWNKSVTELPDPKYEKAKMYLWGNGLYQARPDWSTQFSNFTPKKITCAIDSKNEILDNFVKFRDFVSTKETNFGLDSNGNIWSFDNRKQPSFFDSQDASNFSVIGEQKFNLDETLKNLNNLQFPEKAKKIIATKKLLWGLSENGNLYSHPLVQINKDLKMNQKPVWRKIKTISELKDISSGKSHILMLKKDGSLYAMGKDTVGQCAGGKEIRESGNPEVKIKISNPEKIEFFKNHKVEKVFSKNNHNFIITTDGEVFGFGSNSMMQLAHEEYYSSPEHPHPVFYKPKSFNAYLGKADCDLQDIVLGDEFSFFLCKNKTTKLTQVYGFGLNLQGQLATGVTRHINEFQKIELLSDYTIATEKGEKPLDVSKLTCGSNHCMALMEIGSILIWGSNEYGQIGNKKRSFVVSPMLLNQFKDKKIIELKADSNTNYVLAD